MISTAIVWFRRDLRVADHPALRKAVDEYDRIVPVFIWAPEEEAPWAPGAASRVWLHHSLAALNEDLAARGSPLVIRHGPTLPALHQLARDCGARAVYWNRLYEPALRARDARITAELQAEGLQAESFASHLLLEPWTLQTRAETPYRVFTPFWRSARPQLDALGATEPTPPRIPGPANPLPSVPLAALELQPSIPWDAEILERWTPGEDGAGAQLDHFLNEGLGRYKERRDLPAQEGSSRLSPHLHFGEVSPRAVVARIRSHLAGRGEAALAHNSEHYLRQLGWREFAHHLLYHFPYTPLQPLDERFARLQWRNDAIGLQAWQRGQTGLPIVDAGMRELWRTGWMHNRLRMIVASFLTKNLLLPWQDGARWFWDTLVDADLANNTLGWQWVAGCGADAAPYFRIFNPLLQSAKFDPGGDYLRRFVPELAALPAKTIHVPWQDPAGAPPEYPKPILDLAASRQRALEAFAALKRR